MALHALPSHVWNEFFQQSIGFDKLIDNVVLNSNIRRSIGTSNYPPFNILKKHEEEYEISLAIAGFSKEELTISQHENVLTVKGERETKTDEIDKYLFKGIAERVFKKTFSLHENATVSEVQLKNGILLITIKIDVPEEQKPKIFTIT